MLQSQRAFTLLELLIVMLVLALLAGMALPRFGRLLDSITHAQERQSVVGMLEGLTMQANLQGRTFELQADAPSHEIARLPFLHLPDGWKIKVARPIQFHFSGYCTGGEVELFDPAGESEHLQMNAPRCSIES
ncbi:pilus assembly FimT family protein [Chitinimonas naiadis]